MFSRVEVSGVDSLLDGVLLCGEAEGVEAHRMKNVEALHALVTGNDVSGGVALGMSDMKPATRWIGEHVENVVLGQIGTVTGPEQVVLTPVRLPARLDLLRVVRHRRFSPVY